MSIDRRAWAALGLLVAAAVTAGVLFRSEPSAGIGSTAEAEATREEALEREPPTPATIAAAEPTRDALERVSEAPVAWTGTVVDSSKNPIAGATITVMEGSSASIQHAEPTSIVVTTDHAGRFVVDVDTKHVLLAEKNGFAPNYADTKWQRPFVITLSPAASLIGHVLTEPGRNPVAGARVVALIIDAPPSRYAVVTDARGAFRLDCIDPRGETEILVQAPGAIPLTENVSFGEARTYEHDFLVRTNVEIRGRVIDLESKVPIADASIVPWSNDADDREITRSRADGTFELSGSFDTWNGVGIEVRKLGYAGSRRELREGHGRSADGGELEMGVLRECVLTGVVTDSDGRPVSGASILTQLSNDDRNTQLPIVVPAGLILGGRSLGGASTDAEGRYRIDALLPWIPYRPVLANTREASQSVEAMRFESPGETRCLDWTFPSLDSAIEGRFTVNGARIDVRLSWRAGAFSAEESSNQVPETAADGSFRLTGVPTGEVEVRFALGYGFERHVERVHVTRGATARCNVDLAIDLRQIRGHVKLNEVLPRRRGDAKPVVDLSGMRIVGTRDRDRHTVETRTAFNGSFALTLPDAHWDAWTVSIAEANAATSTMGSSKAPTHSGATALRLSVFPNESK